MSDNRNGFNPAIVNGVALIVVGGVLLLDQMNIISVNFWALIFTVAGLLKIFQSQNQTGRGWGFLLLGIGVAVELEHLGFFRIRLEQTWPVFVIAAGVILLLRAYCGSATESSGILSPHLNVFAVLGGGEYRIRAKNFRGGDLVAFMGGFDVDLRDADIEGNEAVITVNALMGGGVIRVPETWGVSMRVAAFMGGHSLKAREGVQPTKTLVVKGVAIMGGVEVRN
jgi:Cell wall-active antibiotics response 4TMS YvqF